MLLEEESIPPSLTAICKKKTGTKWSSRLRSEARLIARIDKLFGAKFSTFNLLFCDGPEALLREGF